MKGTIERGTLIRRGSGVVATEMDGEYMMMCLEQGTYLVLRNVAARIWELLEQPCTLESLVDALRGEYGVDRDVCEREVADFLRETAGRKLIALADSP